MVGTREGVMPSDDCLGNCDQNQDPKVEAPPTDSANGQAVGTREGTMLPDDSDVVGGSSQRQTREVGVR